MAKVDVEVHKIYKKIFSEGREYNNKNRGVKRLQIPSYTFRHSFKDGFPALTTKKLYFKSIIGELIWFLRGDNDIKYLVDNNIHIWDKDAANYDPVNKRNVGRNYSVQWRDFNGKTDQIKELIEGMKRDIMSSRLKVSAWNPSELNDTALPPCHDSFQVIGVPLRLGERTDIALKRGISFNDLDIPFLEKELDRLNIPEFGFELHWNQRSVDSFLGLPFNIASYATLALILEKMTGYKALGIEGTLKCVHLYGNQYEVAKVQLSRDRFKYSKCELELPYIDYSLPIDEVFNNLKIEDFKIKDYESYPPLTVEMLAPKTL